MSQWDDLLEEEVGSEGTLTDFEIEDASLFVRVPLGAQTTVDGQHDGTDEGTNHEDLTTRHTIRQSDTTQSSNAAGDAVDQVENELHVLVISERLVDGQVEVSETVSRELTEDTHQDNHPIQNRQSLA